MQKPHIYTCDICSYSTERRSSYSKHLNTIKHKRNTGCCEDSRIHKKNEPHICSFCKRSYSNRSGLWKHEQRCQMNDTNNGVICKEEHTSDDTKSDVSSKMIQEMLNYLKENERKHHEQRQMMEIQLQQEREQTQLLLSTVKDMIPKIGNYNNNNININVFLQEHCKDALNLRDFVASLRIELRDLLGIRDRGMIDAVGNVFINGLRQLDLYKRPIHCTDLNMETLYIKDDGEWDGDMTNRGKLRGAISEVAAKQSKIIADWEKSHPDWHKSERLTNEYLMLVRACTHPIEKNSNDENRLIHNIAKEVVVDLNKVENG